MTRYYLLREGDQTCRGRRKTSYSIATWDYSLGRKMAWAWIWQLASICETWIEWYLFFLAASSLLAEGIEIWYLCKAVNALFTTMFRTLLGRFKPLNTLYEGCNGRSVRLTTRVLLLPRLRLCGNFPPFLLTPWCLDDITQERLESIFISTGYEVWILTNTG